MLREKLNSIRRFVGELSGDRLLILCFAIFALVYQSVQTFWLGNFDPPQVLMGYLLVGFSSSLIALVLITVPLNRTQREHRRITDRLKMMDEVLKRFASDLPVEEMKARMTGPGGPREPSGAGPNLELNHDIMMNQLEELSSQHEDVLNTDEVPDFWHDLRSTADQELLRQNLNPPEEIRDEIIDQLAAFYLLVFMKDRVEDPDETG